LEALPLQIPSLSLTRPETLEYPASSMRDFAWPSVKLLAPAAGAPGLLALELETAGVLALGFAGGVVVCAEAPPAIAAPARTVMTAVAKSRLISLFRDCFASTEGNNFEAGQVPRTKPMKETGDLQEPWPAAYLTERLVRRECRGSMGVATVRLTESRFCQTAAVDSGP
jgi:hypothetical protein